MAKQFAVIGLGVLGESVALELMRLGHDVLGVDIDQERAERVADKLTQAVIADATDEEALRELNIERFDAVFIAIGQNIEASTLCTMLVKSLDAKEVWVTAISSTHHRIVDKLGADRIFHPEFEMGLRVAQSLAHRNMLDYIAMGDDYFLVEVRPGENHENSRLDELKIDSHHIHLLAIKHGRKIVTQPPPEHQLRRNDHLVLLGDEAALRRFVDRL